MATYSGPGGQPPDRAVVTVAERERASALVMEWRASCPEDTHLSTACQLELMGMVTAALADARAAGVNDIRAAIVEATGTHDCPACRNTGADCTVCEGWGHL